MPRKKPEDIAPVETPCDGCPSLNNCKTHRLACNSFVKFIQYGTVEKPKDPEPTWELFDDIYRLAREEEEQLTEKRGRMNSHPEAEERVGYEGYRRGSIVFNP